MQHELAASIRAPLPDILPADLPPDHPLDVVMGAHALHSAQTAARSLLSRCVFLADAPAAELATSYMVRRAAQGMANDAAELSRALADIERHLFAALDTLAAANDAQGAEIAAGEAEIASLGAELDALSAEIAAQREGLARLSLAADQFAAAESEGRSHAS